MYLKYYFKYMYLKNCLSLHGSGSCQSRLTTDFLKCY